MSEFQAMVGAGATALEAVLQYQLEHVPTPGPPDYAPDSTRVGGGLLGDAHSVKYSFRGDSFPGPFIETALQESAGPGPAYAPMNGAISTLKVPSYRFGTEEQRPQKRLNQKAPAPNSYSVSTCRTGHTFVGDAPAFGFGAQERLANAAENVKRVPYVGKAHETENYGIFSPGPAAYSPRCLSERTHQKNSPAYTMRPALSCKVGPSGISVSDQKLGDNPGPGKPYLNRFGGGYMGDGPTHKIGTGVKLPNPAENLKKLQYYGRGYDRTYQGLFSPGPAVYSPRAQKGDRGPSYSFGSAPRPCSSSIYQRGSPRLYSSTRTRGPRPPTKPRRSGPAMY